VQPAEDSLAQPAEDSLAQPAEDSLAQPAEEPLPLLVLFKGLSGLDTSNGF
jgi:hypothetical protein